MPIAIQDVNQAVKNVAEDHDIPYANLRAVVEVESNGVVFADVNGKQEPLIRWEGHYFDRRLTGNQRTRARQLGLANPKVGGVANPRSQEMRWNKLLLPASNINRSAAYESCSWGLGQVMGSHWKAFGYRDVMDLVTKARSGVQGQIELMIRYCVVNNLIDELQRGDFTAFARAYNGPGYKKNKYDEKMRELAKQYGGAYPTTPTEDNSNTMVKMGDKGLRVREVQALLVRSGRAVKVDGDFGPATKEAVVDFQLQLELKPDGIVGPETQRALDYYRVDPEEQPGKVTPTEAITETAEGRQGAVATVLGTLLAALANLAPTGLQAILMAVGVVVVVGGVLWVWYGHQKANKTE